ncbi:MAG: hypothetical protein VKI82_12690 [Leptolyngbya sp.]|nr:hypothetical protein [Leptolyngbya sp.]
MANRLFLVPGLGLIALLCGMAPSALAQSVPTSDPTSPQVVDPNAGFGTTEHREGAFGGGSNSPFDLIHRAVLTNEMSSSDFSRIHQNRMATEAANFRALQQEALRRQQATEPGATPAEDTDASL